MTTSLPANSGATTENGEAIHPYASLVGFWQLIIGSIPCYDVSLEPSPYGRFLLPSENREDAINVKYSSWTSRSYDFDSDHNERPWSWMP